MLKKFLKWIALFVSSLSAAEWAWRLLTLAVVAAGGTSAGLLARGTKLFEAAGPFGWFGIGLMAAILVSVIFSLVNVGRRESAEASYLQALSQRRGTVNPLADSFTDQIIYLPDLYLPRRQLHSNKQFKRCKLVGPGAVAMLGGTYSRVNFIEAGSPIVLPDNTMLTGVLVLQNCTVEDCEFIGITLLVNKPAGEAFRKMGAPVVGM